MRARATSLFGLIVALACIGYFIHYVFRYLQLIPGLPWASVSFWLVLVTTIGLYALGATILGLAWSILLRSLDAPMTLGPTIWSVYASQIGKYLPGNVFQFVGRAVIAKRLGCGYLISSASLVLEIVWVIGVGVVIALISIGTDNTISFQDAHGVGEFALFLSIPVVLMMWPPLIRSVARTFGSRIPRLVSLKDAPLPGFLGVISCLMLYALNYMLVGLILYLLSGVFADAPPALSVFGFVGLGGTAWLVGFVTPGAPGGLGVRETLLALFLTPYIGPGEAIAVTLAFRLITVAADGLLFLLGSTMLTRAIRRFDETATT